MASLYITEYGGIGASGAQVPEEPPLAEQKITIGATSLQSAAFAASTEIIRIHGDAISSYAVGEDPTATTSKARLPADRDRYVGVRPGWKIAVIENT